MVLITEPGPSKSGQEAGEEKEKDERVFECNICFDTAKEAVVSLCGHLFCWPCLHQWLDIRPNRQVCPVCKAAISKEKVVPIYGRSSLKQDDPRNKTPPRPAGQRTEPENTAGFPGFGFGDGGFHMSFGIGAFPFGFLHHHSKSGIGLLQAEECHCTMKNSLYPKSSFGSLSCVCYGCYSHSVRPQLLTC